MNGELRARVELREAKKCFGGGFLDRVWPEFFLVTHALHVPETVKKEELEDGPTRVKNHVEHDDVAYV